VKRIAAVAALIVAMLAVPAAAMAGTSSPGSGSGQPGQYQFCQPNAFHHQHSRHHKHHRKHHRRHHKHHRRHHAAFGNCYFPPPAPSGSCQGASFTFSWGSGLSSLYEISGPALYTGEQFSYDGNVYTIVLANTVAGSMELDAVNYGPPIFQGTANLCSG
jgi:hypothetical protein